jgi:hypothetical protein
MMQTSHVFTFVPDIADNITLLEPDAKLIAGVGKDLRGWFARPARLIRRFRVRHDTTPCLESARISLKRVFPLGYRLALQAVPVYKMTVVP